MRVLRNLALVIGGLILGSFLIGSSVLMVRWVQVKTFPQPPSTEHLPQKAAYLDSLGGTDLATAPNIVIIFFDDLGYGDLSMNGNALIDTPRIDTLAGEGIQLTNFYAPTSVCTPSRAALLTGRFPIRSGTQGHVFFPDESPIGTLRRVIGVGNELPADEITVAEALGAAGYATGMIGKWHLGALPGYHPNDFGFDSYYGVHWSNDMQPLHIYRDREIEVADTTEVSNPMNAFRDEDEPFTRDREVDQSRLTRRYTEEAVTFIEKHRDEPFFLYLAHSFPHVPHFPDPEFAGQSRGGPYGDVVEDLDRSTGAIVDAIDRLGLAENTLVIVTSDNGPDYDGSPGGLRGRKGDTYEGGQLVPFIARWPGVLGAGGVISGMSMNTDLLPTILGLAGVPLPADRIIDGEDVFAMWQGGATSPHEVLFYFPVWGDAPVAARDDKFKYRLATGQSGRSKPTLTALGQDQENHNLIKRFPEQAARLSEQLSRRTSELEANPRGWR
ncbi:MAG: sulfatase [Candidatus Binatia bacterium]|nr:sulfatase [Candidatus Binatia bacterium]MDG2009871.1 sulfatase [Candidatus Binatia bacterium]